MFTVTKVVIAAVALGAVQAFPQSHVYQPSAVSSAPPAPTSTPDIFDDLLTAPTAVKRFQRLLVDGAQKLITGEALRKMIVFTFNPDTTPPANSTGGVLAAAVSLLLAPIIQASP
jgi:hypothetical protein